MYKIAICGKANSGKDTISKLIRREISKTQSGIFCEYIAFADPIKDMIRIMFPTLPEKYLTGPSKFRSEIIPGAFKNGKPLTVRQLHTDLGTDIGRAYKETIWLDWNPTNEFWVYDIMKERTDTTAINLITIDFEALNFIIGVLSYS